MVSLPHGSMVPLYGQSLGQDPGSLSNAELQGGLGGGFLGGRLEGELLPGGISCPVLNTGLIFRGHWELCLKHEVFWTSCPSFAEDMNVAKFQGQPISSFKYKHPLCSKLFFFFLNLLVLSSHCEFLPPVRIATDVLMATENLITHMFKP